MDDKPNIILIVCDTLRKDIVDLYGGPAKMPNLGKFAKDSMVYESCIAPATWTFPSHVSLFTGMYASGHGIHETDKIKVEQLHDKLRKLSLPRLPEELQAEGYETICISNNFMINRQAGFEYGFKVFEQVESSPWSQSKLVWKALELGSDPMQILVKLLGRGELLDIGIYAAEFAKIRAKMMINNYPIDKGATRTNGLIEKMDLDKKFFMFINFWEMHEPYKHFSDRELLEHIAGVKQIDRETMDLLKREYIDEAEFLDTQLGRFFDMLKGRKLYDNSMIIITSDHGQEFNEHGYLYHGSMLHDEITRIPLVVKYPHSKKFKKREGYQSLVHIPKLIESVMKGGDDKALTSKAAFSEVYGNVEFIPKSMDYLKKEIEKRYDKSRKSVFMDGYKLTVNGSDGTIEEFFEDGNPVDAKSNKVMLRKLLAQLKKFKGKEAFRLPKL